MKVDNDRQLRAVYGYPREEALDKVQPKIDRHIRDFVRLSPWIIIATDGENGPDLSPRGGEPGFARVLDDSTLLIPDWPGNNRLDMLTNVMRRERVAILFMIPGRDDSLRVKGRAEIRLDMAFRQPFEREGVLPQSVLRIRINEAFLQGGKAAMRAGLWDPAHWPETGDLATQGAILRDHCALPEAESDAALLARDHATLWERQKPG